MTGISLALPHTSQLKRGIFFLAFMALALVLHNFVYGRTVGGFWGNYVLPCLFWGAVIFYIYLQPAPRPIARLRFRPMLNWLAFICALAGVMALFAAGLLQGYGKSPYDLSPRGIIINIIFLSITIAGMELSRSWFFHKLFKKRPFTGIVLVSAFYTLLSFSLTRLTSLSDGMEAVQFVGRTCLPALSESVLTSYLVLLGGVVPAIIYRGTLQAFQWFSPVLPDLSWITHALLGTFGPAFGSVLVYQIYTGVSEKGGRRSQENPTGWIVASVFSILIIWFFIGVFNIFPTAIVSGSMAPAINKGDVVIVKRADPADIKENDIIQFREESVRITHRVIAIKETAQGERAFQTKGDDNVSPDSDLVIPEQLIGKIVHVVSRAGWITIWLRSAG